MSILSNHTEQRAIDIIAECLSHLQVLSSLEMTNEDDLAARKAEQCLLRIINGRPIEVIEVIRQQPVASIIENLYTLVQWPWVQELMEHEWFRLECYLLQAFADQEYFDSAYFVPITRIMEIHQRG
ncbi:hypothetical protein BH09BAC6_BH09BAC6_28350 [soil metagenome]